MMTSLTNLLLYGGLDKDTYNKFEVDILDQDMRNLTLYLLVTAFGYLALGLANLASGQWSDSNTKVYFMTSMLSLTMLTLQQLIVHSVKSSLRLKALLVYLYMAVIYGQAIALTVQHPDLPSVTYLGVLLMLPILFARKPVYTVVLQVVFTVLFCYFVTIYKYPDMANKDVWNGISFCCFSIVIMLVVVPVRIRELAQTHLIQHLSEYDTLTDIKNRNSYETACAALQKVKESKVVIYMDVNGLHQLNDTKGHEAGDIMLRTVADILKEVFGQDHVYRIGGDEFVALLPDSTLRDIAEATALANSKVTDAGYALSIGYARSTGHDEPLNAVIQRAETEMYVAKSAYYKATGKDRRKF